MRLTDESVAAIQAAYPEFTWSNPGAVEMRGVLNPPRGPAWTIRITRESLGGHCVGVYMGSHGHTTRALLPEQGVADLIAGIFHPFWPTRMTGEAWLREARLDCLEAIDRVRDEMSVLHGELDALEEELASLGGPADAETHLG